MVVGLANLRLILCSNVGLVIEPLGLLQRQDISRIYLTPIK